MEEFILVETHDGTTSFRPGEMVEGMVRWQLPEEKTKSLPPHNYTAIAAVYANAP